MIENYLHEFYLIQINIIHKIYLNFELCLIHAKKVQRKVFQLNLEIDFVKSIKENIISFQESKGFLKRKYNNL